MIEPMSMAPLAVVGSTIFAVVVDEGATGVAAVLHTCETVRTVRQSKQTYSLARSSSSSRLRGNGRNCNTVDMIDPMSMAPLAVVGSAMFAGAVEDGATGVAPALYTSEIAAGGSTEDRLTLWQEVRDPRV